MPVCRLLFDLPAEGAWNMALDEALLESVAESDRPVWRFYGWSRPTLSLGYFQRVDDRNSHWPSRQCQLVRRASGGGAIVHDRELTYSLAVPRSWLPTREPAALYRTVHQSLIEALSTTGVVVGLYGKSVGQQTPRDDSFLCFLRRSEADVVSAGVKLAGSAQRRRAGGVLQHGSVLLARSEAAPELSGLAEISGRNCDADWLKTEWLARLSAKTGWNFEPSECTLAEKTRARELAAEKYGTAAWLAGRPIAENPVVIL